jgi:Ca2+-binding RTX toxin-like protein
MRGWRIGGALAVLATALVVGAPVAGSATGPDVSVTQDVRLGVWFQEQVPSTVFDPSQPLVIDDRAAGNIVVIDDVRNLSTTDPATITFREWWALPPRGELPTIRGGGAWYPENRGCGPLWPDVPGEVSTGCTFTLPPRGEFKFDLFYGAVSPGSWTINTSVAADGDPDLSNNSASVSGSSDCAVHGTSGDDSVVIDKDNESYCGGDGNDTITVLAAGDDVFAQGGDDTLDFSRGICCTAAAPSSSIAVGGDGTDTLSYATAPNSLAICGSRRNGGIGSTFWGDTPTPFGHGGGYGFERVIGSPHADWINTDGVATYVDGGGGADIIFGGPKSDTLLGNRGRDRIFSNHDHGHADVVRGGLGRDRARAGRGDRVRSARRAPDLTSYGDPCVG